MKHLLTDILILLALLTVWSCSDDPATPATDDLIREEKTVAVILPMEKGLGEHWTRCLNLFSSNFERAFKAQASGVKLRFEYYDELTADLEEISGELAKREEVYAVIGGLYSSDAAIIASQLTRSGKALFTLATSEELVRGYAYTGYLWAMTETDITQCEVLLSKVVNYGGKSVALIAKDNDIYGQTFIDWFAFQAKELGLENRGTYAYDDSSLDEMTRSAMQSGADYVICVPSEITEIEPMLRTYTSIQPRAAGANAPCLLFSDTAYGADVLSLYGDKAEGIEGVAFGADPEYGFDVSYRTFYDVSPTTGEAQLYDAAMLIGYAAWYQMLHPGVSQQKALQAVVSGEQLSMGSWTGEAMELMVNAFARGDEPYVRGASGSLRFDSKIFTNVLATTYYNYKIYNGQYIILDYNTSDGGNRTDATLAGWNWKASQMQDFDDSAAGIHYPEHKGNWALLVATSSGWQNYRHQADVLAIYQQLKSAGYPDDHIILILADDIANIALPDGTFREEKVTQTNPSWNLAGNTLPNKAGVIITFVPKQNIDASKTYSIAIKGSISTSSYKNQVLVESKTSGVKSDMSVAGNNLAQYYVGKGIGLASGVSATGAIEKVNAGDFDFGLNGVWEWLAGVLTGEEDK